MMTQQPPAPGWGAQPPGTSFNTPQPQTGFAPPPQQAPPQGFQQAPPQGFQQQAPPQSFQQPQAPQGFAPPPQGFTPPPPAAYGQPGWPAAPSQLPMAVQQPGTQGSVQAPAQVPPPVQGTLPFEQPPQQQVPQQQTQPQQQVPQQPQGEPQSNGPTIQQLLREFAKRPNCDRYEGDAEKVKLLEQYLWIRQLTPGLSFELFLTLFETVANFDDENVKHPADAIKLYLPRVKKQAEERGTHHWAAKEVVDYVALYVDMIREAESTNSPIPMDFNSFLSSKPLLEQFHAGAFKEVAAPKAPRSRSTGTKTATPKTTDKVRPSTSGQRTIYSSPSGRQHRGYMTNVWQDDQTKFTFGDFRSDSGEEFKGITIDAFEVTDDPPPNQPQTPAGDQLPEMGRGRLLIPKAQFPSVLQALTLPVPIGTVAVGEVAYSFNHGYGNGYVAVIDIVNGEQGPYVDAYLCLNDPNTVVGECNQPRKNVEGSYTLPLKDGTGFFTLEVVGNQ